MASSPDRISSGASAAAAKARRPMASRTLASTSAGPAVCKITSSAPHSALTAARPPSVTIANSGQSRPVVCSSRQILLAWARSRRASTSTASAGGASTRADASAGSTRTGVQQQPQRGQHLGGRLERAGDQQQVAHSMAPPHLVLAPYDKQSRTRGQRRPGPADRRISQMAKVTIQYWAAAKEAAGRGRRIGGGGDAGRGAGRDPGPARGDAGHERLRSVLAASSFLVDGAPAGRRVPADAGPSGSGPDRGAAAVRRRLASRRVWSRSAASSASVLTADWMETPYSVSNQYVPKSDPSGGHEHEPAHPTRVPDPRASPGWPSRRAEPPGRAARSTWCAKRGNRAPLRAGG